MSDAPKADRRAKRFKPRNEIEWLDQEQRQAHRTTLGVFSELATLLERGKEPTKEQEALLLTFTKSTNTDTRLNTIWNMLDQTESAYIGKLAAMAPYDLAAYHEMVNPHEPPAAHHLFICDHLMKVEAGEIATLVLSLPPGSAKSTYGSRSFAQWFMGRNPDKRVLAVGHSQKFVEDEFSKPNRNVIGSDIFGAAFPDVILNPNEKSSSFWRLEGWRGSYACRGALAGVAGLRANLILGDDPFKTAADAMSETIRGNIWRWWTADLMSRRLPGAPQVLIMTRWHSEDVAGHIERLNNEYQEARRDNPRAKSPIPQPAVILNIPAEAEENDPLGREVGEWLWQDFYGPEHYETLRATMPPSLWAALYLGKPMDTMGDYISEEQFLRYDRPPVNVKDKPLQWVKTVMSVDSASKGNERSDNTAILVFRQDTKGTHYLVDVWKGKPQMEVLIRTMSRMMRHWQVNYALIEDSGMGIQILENYQGKLPAPLTRYTPSGKGSKDFRFDAAAPWITSGKILFPKQAPWLVDFINELVAFPNGANDDQVDAFSQYCDHALKVRVGGTRPLKMRG